MKPITFQSIEEQADRDGKGSVWRACLAVQRSSKNESLGQIVLRLGHGYCSGKSSNIRQLSKVVKELWDSSSGEFREALTALKNAIEMAPKKGDSKLDSRQELWMRLERLTNTHQN